MITVVGWPRSGTHWLQTILQSALDEEVGHSHVLPEQEGEYVFIVRDPRDTFASHWKLYQHDGGEATEIEFVHLLLKGGMQSHQGWNIGWVPYMRRLLEWHEAHRVPLVRYEELWEMPECEAGRVIGALGRGVAAQKIIKAVRDTRGIRCDPSSLPVEMDMGEPGKWIGRIRPVPLHALLNYCRGMMYELGYT